MDLVDALLATVAGDLAAARACREAGCWPACAFFAQQAAEKAVKAWLLRRGVDAGRTHYTSPVLLRVARRAKLRLEDVIAGVHDLEEYAAGARYPVRAFPRGFEPPAAAIDAAEAGRALEQALRVVAALRSGGDPATV